MSMAVRWVGLLLALPFIGATAGEYTASASGPAGTVVVLEVSFAGDGATAETQTDLLFEGTYLSVFKAEVLNDATQCRIVAANRLRIIPPSGGSNALPSTATAYCRFHMAISDQAPPGFLPFSDSNIECTNAGAFNEPCSLSPTSGITVTSGVVQRTLGYSPSPGSLLSFAVGMSPGSAAPPLNIAVTASGNAGSASLTNCSISGAGAASFSLDPSSLHFSGSATQNLVVGCTYGSTTAEAALSCTETDGDTPPPGAQVGFLLRCPSDSVPPTVGSLPRSGFNLQVQGATVGALAIGNMYLTNNGGSGGAGTAVSCTSSGSVLLGSSSSVPAGQGPINQVVMSNTPPIALRVGVVTPAAPQLPAGFVTCMVEGQPSIVIGVNASLAFPPDFSPPPTLGQAAPVLVPVASNWANLALLLFVLGLGVAAVGRR